MKNKPASKVIVGIHLILRQAKCDSETIHKHNKANPTFKKSILGISVIISALTLFKICLVSLYEIVTEN